MAKDVAECVDTTAKLTWRFDLTFSIIEGEQAGVKTHMETHAKVQLATITATTVTVDVDKDADAESVQRHLYDHFPVLT